MIINFCGFDVGEGTDQYQVRNISQISTSGPSLSNELL